MKFTFVYTGIRVRDLDRSLAFYTDVLGLKLLGRGTVAKTGGKVASVGTEGDGHVLELNWYPDDSPMAGPYRSGEELDHLAFGVEDLEGALAHLKEHGHPEVLRVEGKESVWAYVQDPDGLYIELFESS